MIDRKNVALTEKLLALNSSYIDRNNMFNILECSVKANCGIVKRV